jgi:hypothetical protein
MQIDHWGEILEGCVRCNAWGVPGSDRRWRRLPEEDVEALRSTSQWPRLVRASSDR